MLSRGKLDMCSQFAVLTQYPHNTFKDTVFWEWYSSYQVQAQYSSLFLKSWSLTRIL